MSNEQKAKEIANDNCTHICLADCSAESYFSSENDCYKAAMAMAEWKDEQYKVREEGLRETINALEARLQKSNESGMYYFDKCNILKQQFIEKACEWWNNEFIYPTMTQAEIDWYQTKIAQFKRAMKGE